LIRVFFWQGDNPALEEVLSGSSVKRYTREILLTLKDKASRIEELAIAIPAEIDVNGKGLITDKGRDLARPNFSGTRSHRIGDAISQGGSSFSGLVLYRGADVV